MLSRVSQVSRVGYTLARASSTARVWIDKNTKVIGQGITGKNVGCAHSADYDFRVLSTPNKPSNTVPKWSVVLTPRRPAPLTWACPSSPLSLK